MFSIAIDGPSGAGKSTLADALSEKLGCIHLDTGAIYRTVALFVIESGVDPKDTEGVIALIPKTDIKIEYIDGKQRMLMSGEDVTGRIRTPEISAGASVVSAIPEVRTYLLDLQRDFARKNSVIMDGRDIGTVILPNATVKFFMTASDDARAERRCAELREKGENVTLDDVKAAMAKRDENDKNRKTAPAIPADDAIPLDNSGSFDETVKKALKIIKKTIRKKRRNEPLFAFWKHLLRPVFTLVWLLNIRRPKDEDEGRGLIIASNHISALDPVYLALRLKRQVWFMAKAELGEAPFLGRLIARFGVTVKRGQADVGAIRKSVEILKENKALCVFPQGTRMKEVHPKETEFKSGVGMMAFHSKCDVLPAYIYTKGYRARPFKTIRIRFGDIIRYDELGLKTGNFEEFDAATAIIREKILALAPDNEKKEG